MGVKGLRLYDIAIVQSRWIDNEYIVALHSEHEPEGGSCISLASDLVGS